MQGLWFMRALEIMLGLISGYFIFSILLLVLIYVGAALRNYHGRHRIRRHRIRR